MNPGFIFHKFTDEEPRGYRSPPGPPVFLRSAISDLISSLYSSWAGSCQMSSPVVSEAHLSCETRPRHWSGPQKRKCPGLPQPHQSGWQHRQFCTRLPSRWHSECIHQSKTPLGIRIDYFHGFSAHGSITSPARYASRISCFHKLQSRHDVHLQLELGNCAHGSDGCCSTTHIIFHGQHSLWGFDAIATTIIGEPFSDEPDGRSFEVGAPK